VILYAKRNFVTKSLGKLSLNSRIGWFGNNKKLENYASHNYLCSNKANNTGCLLRSK
jgi:hypothetical protein